MNFRRLAVPLVTALALFGGSQASAVTVTLWSSASATGIDGGSGQGGAPDGNFSQFDFNPGYRVSKTQDSAGLTERRTIFEFDVPAALKQPGVVIQNATFTVQPPANGAPAVMLPDSRLQLYGYSGNGQADTTDFLNNTNFLWSYQNTQLPLAYNITPHVDAIRATSARVGLLLTTNYYGGNYPIGGATLVVEYTSPVNTPPTVSISSPASNTVFAPGTPVTFQGTASDGDGDAVGAVNWTSNLDGPLGSGSSITVSSLSTGSHLITASTTDSKGASGQAQIVVTVGTPPPPSYCTARGNTSSYEWIRAVTVGSWANTSNNNGGYGDFTSSPSIPVGIGVNTATLQPGFMSGGYSENWRVWIDLNRDGTFSSNELLYSGAGSSTQSAMLTIPAGTSLGTTRMRVAMSYGTGAQPCGTFSYGEVEDYTVDIGATPPPPPPQYCSTTSNNNSNEWISQVQIGNTVRSTGRGARYNDYTTQTVIPLSRGTTSVTLIPGFSNAAYYEHWRIWIDYNKDGVFGTDEVAMAPVESPSTIYGSITVPSSALAGTTRMRVSMSNGWAPPACGSFMYGEVEDYTVAIAP